MCCPTHLPPPHQKKKKEGERTKINLLDHLTVKFRDGPGFRTIKTLWIALSLFLFFSFFPFLAPFLLYLYWSHFLLQQLNFLLWWGSGEGEVWSEAVSSWYYTNLFTPEWKALFFSSIFVKTPGKEYGWLVWLTPPPFYDTHSGHWDKSLQCPVWVACLHLWRGGWDSLWFSAHQNLTEWVSQRKRECYF